jgi:tyrosine-protein phosphatase SIW14
MRLRHLQMFRYALTVLSAAALAGPAAAQVPAAVATAPASAVTSTIASPPEIRIDNFGSINASYFRGAQPKGSDYADLAALGIKTVIDLQADGDDREEGLVEKAGMNFYRIPMTTSVPPTPEQIATFLEIVNDPARQPVYVHCKGGKHRTGVMTAIYRMEKDGWTGERAFGEMKQYKFGMDILHPEFKSFVLRYKPTSLATAGAALK